MNESLILRSEKKPSKRSLSLARTFFGRNKPDEQDVGRYPRPGDTVNLESSSGKLRLSDGAEATLKELVEISIGGVILFAYPKAHTPGCLKQACLFRDAYQDLTSVGFAVYGLSRDSVSQNASFREHHRLPFRLICDERGSLIKALGLVKRPNETMRAVIVINKAGKVLASMAGNPSASLEAVAPIVQTLERLEHHPKTSEIPVAPGQEHLTRVPVEKRPADGNEHVEDAQATESRSAIRPAARRHTSADRTGQEAAMALPPRFETNQDLKASIDFFAEHKQALVKDESQERCVACGREHRSDEACDSQVMAIREACAKFTSAGSLDETNQRELANKLALLTGELAVIAARLDARFREEQGGK